MTAQEPRQVLTARECSDGQNASKRWTGLVLLVMALAFSLRAWYAWELPLQWDEVWHWDSCEEISLRPGAVHLPLKTSAATHAPGVLYTLALTKWISGDHVFAVRMWFIGFQLVGLWGLYALCDRLFGRTAAMVALLLAAVDRHLVAMAPVFLESPAVINVAPWLLLAVYQCDQENRWRDWLAVGGLVGLAYWLSTVSLAMVPAAVAYWLVRRRGRALLCSPRVYVGAAVAALMIAPFPLADWLAAGSHLERNLAKTGNLGLSPRMALLYWGDCLICLKPSTWIVRHVGEQMYAPVYIPCFWPVGLLYGVAALVALRRIFDPPVCLLWITLVAFIIPVTLLDAREPWNEFTWGSATVFVAVALAARWLTSSQGKRKLWKILLPTTAIVVAAAGLWNPLSGIRWGYDAIEPERAFVGTVLALDYRSDISPERWPRGQAIEEIHRRVQLQRTRDPQSVVALYFQAFHASDESRRETLLQEALKLAPGDGLLNIEWAEFLLSAGRWDEAERQVVELVDREGPQYDSSLLLARINVQQGDLTAAAEWARRAAQLRPEAFQPYRLLYQIHVGQGDERKADEAVAMFARRHPSGAAMAILALAEQHCDEGDLERGRELLDKAIGAGAHRADFHRRVGFLFLSRLKDPRRGAIHFAEAARLGSSDPLVYYNLGLYQMQQQQYDEAIASFRQAVTLDPQLGAAHWNLAVLLRHVGRDEEASFHAEAARRAGNLPLPPDLPGSSSP